MELEGGENMTILASASNISADRALTIAAASLEKKGLAFWSPSYKVVSVDREAILVRYVPIISMQICFAIPGGLRGKMGGGRSWRWRYYRGAGSPWALRPQ